MLAALYRAVRGRTEALVAPLAVEDMVVQTMPEASPTKWHLAHTSWFFDRFVLSAHGEPTVTPPGWETLFNSYYLSVGEPHARGARGHLSRPTVAEVRDYRRRVDERVEAFLPRAPAAALEIVEVGLNHEEQHQELILTDLKHVLGTNPLDPVFRPRGPDGDTAAAAPLAWQRHAGGTVDVGHVGPSFAYDNELPRHRVLLAPFDLASRAVTCGEWLAFMADGGYGRPELWLSDGWDACRQQGWRAPLYWRSDGGGWTSFTLSGRRAVRESEPVCHVSFYEADAFARWSGARLPLEEEWEHAASAVPVAGNLLDSERLHPAPARDSHLFGDVWVWTASPYVPYPGYRPFQGALAEYNGKFMVNQLVLRGGSCFTPARHLRASYRNFFPPSSRWQVTGVRLAR